jgi:LuxR family maltose regulon positive regulatory protein
VEALKLHWLGSPIIELKGRAIKLETRKAAAMLAYLSFTPRECQREILATMFWPDGSQQKALSNLRRTLSSLNSSLPMWIASDRTIIRLKREVKLWVDAEAFHQLLSQFKQHAHPESEVCDACLSVLDQTVKLYRGDFLDGLNLSDCPSFDEWQFFQRDSLRQEFTDVLRWLSAGHAQRCHWDSAITYARRWVALDRLHEPAYRALMDLYARSGQRTAALRQYEELKRQLQEQIDQAPEPETYKLYEQIRGHAETKHIGAALEPPISMPLLKTKLYIPTAPALRVIRSHLITRLDEVEKKSLTIISAPAGFGKTTLLAEWIAQTALPVAWLSLDNGDNDSYRFLSYLTETLESIHEDVGREARQLMLSSHMVPAHIILASLLNSLETLAEPCVIVFDDYQFITEHAVHETTSYLLDHLPSNLHVVLATRADPPLQLGRLRAHDQLLELRTHDLRFTAEEAEVFLNDVMRLGLTLEDIESLETRTEGWAVGLQMAAISLKDLPDRSSFIQTFSGSHRFVLDYLVQEVLNHQPEHVQDFLLNTSILDRFCSELCEAVTEKSREPAVNILDYLERSNLFLIPLDEERHWYRYHHLFADLLAAQLQRLNPAVIRALHVRASSWYEVNGHLDSAVEHALAADDFEQAADLVEKDAQRVTYQVEFARLQRWIDRLPQEMILSRAWIAITQGWLWLVAGKQPALINWMDQIEENFNTVWVSRYSENSRQDLLANIKSLRAYISFFAGDAQKSIILAQEALHLISPANEALRVRLLVQIGTAHLMSQDLLTARAFLYQGIELGIQIGDSESSTTGLIRLFRTLRLLGKLSEAETITQRVIQALSETGRMHSPIAGKPELCWGDLLRERGHKEAAQDWLDRGLLHVRQYKVPYEVVSAIVYKAKWFLSEGLLEDALQLLDDGLPLLKAYSMPPTVALSWTLCRANVLLEKGDFQAVEALIEGLSLRSDDAFMYLQEEAYMVLARLQQRKGLHREALDLLGKLAESSEAGCRNGILIQILILQAISLRAQGLTELALGRLEKCLSLAQSEGYLMNFLDEGPQVEVLLQALQARGLPSPLRAYAEEIIQAFDRGPR